MSDGDSSEAQPGGSSATGGAVRLFLTGDVMTGRGIDQILPHPADPRLHEQWAKSAARYVELAEAANGPIPRAVGFDYIWGDALRAVGDAAPAARIVNLETSITDRMTPVPKGINYKMGPGNVPCLTAFGIDCCTLANNHVADWGRGGLGDTLMNLQAAGIATAGAGADAMEAWAPAVLPLGTGGRLLVLAVGSPSSGVPANWAARADAPGVAYLADFSDRSLEALAALIGAAKRPGDVVVVSIHWGGNWGYRVPSEQRRFAQALVGSAGADIVFGHSSHHPKAIEVHRGKLILYGSGDFLNDYEGIGGEERFRPELTLGYLAEVEPAAGTLRGLTMLPFRLARFRLGRAAAADAAWLAETLSDEGAAFGTKLEVGADGNLRLAWS